MSLLLVSLKKIGFNMFFVLAIRRHLKIRPVIANPGNLPLHCLII